MRTGACIVQHGLTPEAAGVVNQAVTLARRRGHAQVTPLHVANVLLSYSSSSTLRTACLRSHSHPLRCKALELCFNVALNRLPSAAASAGAAPPLLSPPPTYRHGRLPSLSNALVAAFKRAQANQRRGSSAAVDAAATAAAAAAAAQQPPPPLLAVRIEVEHLVVSILDDPSVSRVMREAGFCSTQVKTNVENASSSSSPEITEIAAPNSDLVISKPIKTKPSLTNAAADDDEAIVSLGLSLNFHSDLEGLGNHQLTLERDLSINHTSKHHNKNYSSFASTLPLWLQQHKEDNSKRRFSVDEYDDLQLDGPYRNWSSALKTRQHCDNNNPSQMMMFNFSSPSPCDSSSSSSSVSSFSQSSLILHHGLKLSLPDQNPSARSACNKQMHLEKPINSTYNASFCPNPNSTTSSSTMEMEYIPKFKELNAENLKVLCSSLEKKAPWQRENIPGIASAVLRRRSGMMRRRGDHWSKEATWMLFQGRDTEGERKISEELASLVFSSPTNLVRINGTKEYYHHHQRSKRSRTEASGCSYLDRLFEEINENPHRVFLIEDIEQVDLQVQVGIKNAMESGTIRSCSGEEEVSVSDAIIVLSCKSFKCRSCSCRSPANGRRKEEGTRLSLDLNLSAPAYDLDEDDSSDDAGIMELLDGAFFFN